MQHDEQADVPPGTDGIEVRLGDLMRGERATLGKSLLDVQRELRIRASYVAAKVKVGQWERIDCRWRNGLNRGAAAGLFLGRGTRGHQQQDELCANPEIVRTLHSEP